VENLGERSYLDNLDGRNRNSQPADSLTFDREVDRIYVEAPADIKVRPIRGTIATKATCHMGVLSA
jgi:D-hexose-6-phosphate mutarotase